MSRTHRYETIGRKEVLSVELPDGIGVVHIRTGSVEGRTGDPVIGIEVASDTLDTPAADGRYYESRFNSVNETLYLIGRLPDPDSARSCGCGGTGTHGVDHED
jgi:hypothetical protein